MTCYLFSNIDKNKGFTKEQSKYLKEDITSNMTITFIASKPYKYNKNDMYKEKFIKFFKNVNINFEKVNLIDGRVNASKSKKLIETADIIFLMGGNPETQMKFIKENDLVNSIKKCNLILGVSAGSMNQSKRIIYIDDFDNYKIKDYEGIGIVNINIFPHFDINNENQKQEVKEISKQISMILLPNDSFIKIKNEQINIIGKSYKIFKEKLEEN